ncbi:MAG: ECF RNA polymerase sigma-E factor [Gemmatimonadales bacterium]|nr:MAG: ECF RNA polymerase sigma-E factor [Gemmatimonadales bacterium]
MPETPSSDQDLIERWRRGDEAAAAELVRRHARAVAQFLAAAGAGGDLEDLVQEAFFRAFRRIDTFRGGASFRTWVMAIASNALKDLRRRERRRIRLDPLDRDAAHHNTPYEDARASELQSRFEQGVSRLPPMQRDVFLLRAQQGLSYEEIAAALGTTPGAARVHYHHAVQRLKKLLEE